MDKPPFTKAEFSSLDTVTLRMQEMGEMQGGTTKQRSHIKNIVWNMLPAEFSTTEILQNINFMFQLSFNSIS